MKRTKIIATLSDLRCSEAMVKDLYDAGVDIVRINSAHASLEGATKIVEIVHRVNPAIPIVIDTKGPEIRVTAIAAEEGDHIDFKVGDRIVVRGSDGSDATTRNVVYMNVPGIVADIPTGARMLIADGELEIRVLSKNARELTCEFTQGGAMYSRKSVNVPGVSIDLPSVTEKDRRFIEWAIANDVDFIAHSFVRGVKDLAAVQEILDAHHSPIKIISKIENQEGLNHIDEIIEKSYGIMVARGDLGVELPAEMIPNTQRRIVEKCIAAKRPVIIATQMLYSMVHSPRPTRAEVSDIASAIYERVDSVMLSDETASGDYPVEAVKTMARVIREIERDEAHFKPMFDIDMVSVNHEITAQLARSAVKATDTLPIKFIVLDTDTGRTGRYVAAFRGQKPVLAVCYTRHTQRIMSLSYGVMPILRTHELKDKYHFLTEAIEYLSRFHTFRNEDLLAVVGGTFSPSHGASYLEIANVGSIRERNATIDHTQMQPAFDEYIRPGEVEG